MKKDRVLMLNVRLRKQGLLFTVSILAILILFSVGVSPVYADTLSTTEIQITDTAAHESRPTLGADVVVYTSQDFFAGANAKIYGWMLNSAGQPIQSISVSDPYDIDTDDRLNDVSGSTVLYTARDTTGPTWITRLVTYDLVTEQRTDIVDDAGGVFEARIDGNRVVFVQGDIDSTVVQYVETDNPAFVATLSGPSASQVAIGSDLIVWTEAGTEIWAFNPITQDYGLVEQNGGSNPATSGDWVVYEYDTGAGIEIVAKQLSLAPNQAMIQVVDSVVFASQADGVVSPRNPDIDGDLIAYEAVPAGGNNYDIYLYRLSDGATFQVTNDGADQELNSIYGDKVAYGDYRSGAMADIWLSTLTFVTQHSLTLDTTPTGVTTPAGDGTYDDGTYATISTEQYIYITPDTRYRFTGWTTGDMTEITDATIPSTTVLMDKDKTVTANYVLQYLVTFDQTGLDSSATSMVVKVVAYVCTNPGSCSYMEAILTYTDLPWTTWIESDNSVQYIYAYVSSSDSGKRFRPDSVTGPTSPITVTGPTVVTGNYATQYYLTVTSPYDTPGGEGWYNQGETAYAILLTDVEAVGDTVYGFVGWTGDTSGGNLISDPILMDAPKTATANWEATTAYGNSDVMAAGFWKRQINVWYFTVYEEETGIRLRGVGQAQESKEDVLAWLQFVDSNSDYFRGEIVRDNDGDGTITDLEILENAYNIVKNPRGPNSMKARAEQKLLIVWLNLARNAFFLNTGLDQALEFIYQEYGLQTIGEAILFAEAELLNPDGNYEAVKDICDSINNNLGIIWY